MDRRFADEGPNCLRGYDVALFELQEDIEVCSWVETSVQFMELATPACLPNLQASFTDRVQILGWGDTLNSDDNDRTKRLSPSLQFAAGVLHKYRVWNIRAGARLLTTPASTPRRRTAFR